MWFIYWRNPFNLAVNALCDICLLFSRQKREKLALEEKHKQEVEKYLLAKRAQHAKCVKRNHSEDHSGYNSDSSRPHTPPPDVGATVYLRNIVSKLREISKDGDGSKSMEKTEKLANIDKDLQYVQQYLSSGRPYPRVEVLSPMTRNNISFALQQPNSSTVQSIVKRVLTAGHERENLIKTSHLDVPESVFEPHNKQAHDSLNNVMNTVIQALQHPPVSPRHDSALQAANQNRNEQVQKIREQVKSSHQSILEGVQRSLSQPSKSQQSLDNDMLSSQQSDPGHSEMGHRSLRQREIQSALSQSMQHIERAIQLQQTSKNSQQQGTATSPASWNKEGG